MKTSMAFRGLALGLAALCVSAVAPSFRPTMASEADTAPEAIRRVMMSTFDKPEARLRVEPVVVIGDHAVAGWTQGERGGRALLARDGQGWKISLCAGDGLKDAAMLQEAGLAPGDAQSLVAALVAAEAKLPAATLARFASFDGVVRMDGHGEHPPAHAH